MKKILIMITASLLAVQISNAQTAKGTQTFGGYLSLRHSLTTDQQIQPLSNILLGQTNTITDFSIGPSYSYFIADRVELSGTLAYSAGKSSSKNINGTTNTVLSDLAQSSNSFGGSVSLRKYFMHESKIGIRTGPYVSYFRGNTKYSSSTNSTNSTGKSDAYSAGANLDLVYYPSKNLGLAATLANLGYSNVKTTYPGSSQLPASNKNENLNLSFIGSDLSLSVFYVFGGK